MEQTSDGYVQIVQAVQTVQIVRAVLKLAVDR
jgi:hypothetical protein